MAKGKGAPPIAVRRRKSDEPARMKSEGLAKLRAARAGGQDPYAAAADALAAARQHRPQRAPRIVPWRTGEE